MILMKSIEKIISRLGPISSISYRNSPYTYLYFEWSINFDKIHSKNATSTWLHMHSFYWSDKFGDGPIFVEFVNIVGGTGERPSTIDRVLSRGTHIFRMFFVKIHYTSHHCSTIFFYIIYCPYRVFSSICN